MTRLRTLAGIAVTILMTAIARQGESADGDVVAIGATLSVHDTAPTARLLYDYTQQRPVQPDDEADVWLSADEHSVRTFAKLRQREPLEATISGNGIDLSSDDYFELSLWPSGPTGIRYTFRVNPRGAHIQYSSQNAVYSPAWRSEARPMEGGYELELAIPRAALRGTARADYRIHLARHIARSDRVVGWIHGRGQVQYDEPTYGARIQPVVVSVNRRIPRASAYVFDSSGGQTARAQSRAGADLSLPITKGSSLVATYQPDSSNLDRDQTSIAPTAFQRTVTDVRPFFAQGMSLYQSTMCYDCPGVLTLYTPAIPTPQSAVALQGTEGNLSYHAFQSSSPNRSDRGGAVLLKDRSGRWQSLVETVAVTAPGFGNVENVEQLRFTDLKRFTAYALIGTTHGSGLAVSADRRYFDTGASYNDGAGYVSLSRRHIGAGFAPADGYIAQSDLDGYGSYARRRWLMPTSSNLVDIVVQGFKSSYRDSGGNVAQTEQHVDITSSFKNQVGISATSGSEWVREGTTGTVRPFTLAKLGLTYRATTSTPAMVYYSHGGYYDGQLTSWQRQLNARLGRSIVDLELDSNSLFRASNKTVMQTYESLSSVVQLSPDATLTAGIRRIIGDDLPSIDYASRYRNATNLIVALHLHRRPYELYAAYGDAGALSTRHTAALKLIYYVSGEKGT